MLKQIYQSQTKITTTFWENDSKRAHRKDRGIKRKRASYDLSSFLNNIATSLLKSQKDCIDLIRYSNLTKPKIAISNYLSKKYLIQKLKIQIDLIENYY